MNPRLFILGNPVRFWWRCSLLESSMKLHCRLCSWQDIFHVLFGIGCSRSRRGLSNRPNTPLSPPARERCAPARHSPITSPLPTSPPPNQPLPPENLSVSIREIRGPIPHDPSPTKPFAPSREIPLPTSPLPTSPNRRSHPSSHRVPDRIPSPHPTRNRLPLAPLR